MLSEDLHHVERTSYNTSMSRAAHGGRCTYISPAQEDAPHFMAASEHMWLISHNLVHQRLQVVPQRLAVQVGGCHQDVVWHMRGNEVLDAHQVLCLQKEQGSRSTHASHCLSHGIDAPTQTSLCI